jgi:hypothetical protein
VIRSREGERAGSGRGVLTTHFSSVLAAEYASLESWSCLSELVRFDQIIEFESFNQLGVR